MVVGDRSKSYSWLKFYYSIKLMIMLAVDASTPSLSPAHRDQWRILSKRQESPLGQRGWVNGLAKEMKPIRCDLPYCSSKLFSNATIPA